jgi:TusA-related sulfurtransferase
VAAGFVDFAITWRADVFSGAPQSSSAANYGTVGINFRARKAANEDEWARALAALSCATAPQNDTFLGADAFYDAGDKGCGAGPLDEIVARMRLLAPGQTLEVHATDPSVANDLPAWCRLAGHELLPREGDRYLIRRRG